MKMRKRNRAVKNKLEKHVPLRMCIVCRSMKPKEELVRIVNEDGSAKIDEKNRVQSRGAYICRCGECSQKLRKKRILDRAFRAKQPESAYNEVERYFQSIGENEELY